MIKLLIEFGDSENISELKDMILKHIRELKEARVLTSELIKWENLYNQLP